MRRGSRTLAKRGGTLWRDSRISGQARSNCIKREITWFDGREVVGTCAPSSKRSRLGVASKKVGAIVV